MTVEVLRDRAGRAALADLGMAKQLGGLPVAEFD
jgi:hypothetical protein